MCSHLHSELLCMGFENVLGPGLVWIPGGKTARNVLEHCLVLLVSPPQKHASKIEYVRTLCTILGTWQLWYDMVPVVCSLRKVVKPLSPVWDMLSPCCHRLGILLAQVMCTVSFPPCRRNGFSNLPFRHIWLHILSLPYVSLCNGLLIYIRHSEGSRPNRGQLLLLPYGILATSLHLTSLLSPDSTTPASLGLSSYSANIEMYEESSSTYGSYSEDITFRLHCLCEALEEATNHTVT